MFRIELCASCKKRTDKPDNVLKYRKNVGLLKACLQNAIKIQNPYNSNPYICRQCCDTFNKIGSINDELNDFLVSSYAEDVNNYEAEEEAIKSCVLDFDSIDSKRCFRLTGITKKDLNTLSSQLASFEPQYFGQ